MVQKKILILGLDNSGKTSVLLSLTKTTNLLSYFSLKPTKGIQIENIEDGNTKFSIWDFGGQERYRKDYLKNMTKYTPGADEIIYVIDVQDTRRYEEAIEYLQKILDSIGKPDQKITLSIFLHKLDPPITMLDRYSDKQIATKLVAKIFAIIPTTDYICNFFKTSIYTVFQKSKFQTS